ncbi:MAG: cupin domain-containing protein [Gammaproteobacteria bacterium]|nr:cupin domain-containing protein [Gammaproteobacteria bacterium]
MRQTRLLNTALLVLVGTVAAASVNEPSHPAKLSRGDIAGEVFDRADMIEHTENGNTTLDVTSFLSGDKKFGTGMYKSGAVRFEITEPYGVDEFMYFLEGGVTLTSSDGVVQVINAGEAVTIPKEWTGIWDTQGYTKIWVIYSEDGSGLE